MMSEENSDEDIFEDKNKSEDNYLADSSPAKPKESLPLNENDETNDIVIHLNEPEKIGDGMSAFMVYRILTKTSLTFFKAKEFSVKRRFSDFLGLHDKLMGKHFSKGILFPPAPEKSVLGMTKIKISKEEQSGAEFIERRRASLERYLNYLARHKVLLMDSDFREFLEFEGDLPRAVGTQAISGAGVMRLFKNVGDAMGKFTYKTEETDQWFDNKTQEIEDLERNLVRLHGSLESLVIHRKDMITSSKAFSQSLTTLSNVEEHTGIACALTQLAETHRRIDTAVQQQADSELYNLAEVVKDYIGFINSIKDSFNERNKAYKTLQDAELMLTRKREQKVKLELAHKTDKVPAVETEIKACESKVESEKENFDQISEMIKKELARFDKNRIVDFKNAAIKCLETMLSNQETVIKHWEEYLPKAKEAA